MLLTCFYTAKVLQVVFRDVNTAMAHFTRKAQHIAALLHVHLRKCMTEGVSRNAHAPIQMNACRRLHAPDNGLDTGYRQSGTLTSSSTTQEQGRFIGNSRLAILVDVLPHQLSHVRIQSYL